MTRDDLSRCLSALGHLTALEAAVKTGSHSAYRDRITITLAAEDAPSSLDALRVAKAVLTWVIREDQFDRITALDALDADTCGGR